MLTENLQHFEFKQKENWAKENALEKLQRADICLSKTLFKNAD